jgi:quinol monooxygenase YgiN
MYGLIEKLVAVPGQRDKLVAVLTEGCRELPGCLSYVIATDLSDANGVWVTEVWDEPQSQRAAMLMPAVQRAVAASRPLIESFGGMTITEPVGGHVIGKRLGR